MRQRCMGARQRIVAKPCPELWLVLFLSLCCPLALSLRALQCGTAAAILANLKAGDAAGEVSG